MYQLLEKWVAHERGARTCTRFPQGCIYSWEISRHAIGANTPHPLLTTLLLLWAEPSFPSMCNSAEPKQSVKAFVTSPRIVRHSFRWVLRPQICACTECSRSESAQEQKSATPLHSTRKYYWVAWRGYEATSALSYGEITTSSNAAPQQDALKFKLQALIFGKSLTTRLRWRTASKACSNYYMLHQLFMHVGSDLSNTYNRKHNNNDPVISNNPFKHGL